MENITLKATPRDTHGKGASRRLRTEGFIPVVAYGLGADTASFAIGCDALRDILLSERGRNSIISFAVEGGKSFPVMVKDYVVHPLSRKLLHADFMRIDEKKKLEVEVPFRTTGKSKGEIEGGTLLPTLRTLTVRCLPSNIPDEVVFDVSHMQINDMATVGELTFPDGVEPLLDPTRKAISVKPPRVEAEADEDAEGEEGAEGAEGAEGDDDKSDGDDKKSDGDDKDKDKKKD
jgi:large subunit ribosomal protein L25